MKDPYEEYLEAGVMPRNLEPCPHLIKKSAGDLYIYLCKLTERPSGRIKPCLKEYGEICETYNEILEEWRNENNSR